MLCSGGTARANAAVALTFATLTLSLTAAQAADVSYELAARVPLKAGAAQGVLWLDNDNYLTLEVSTDKVLVWRTSYSKPLREEFLSAAFMNSYVCGPELAGTLSWRLSPGRRFLFFSWKKDNEDRAWTLLDISDAPDLRLKRFPPPAGMQIDEVLFSPDDRFAVFRHDYAHEGSAVSLLVMNLAEGREFWRVPAGQLGFIERMWWSSAIYDVPRFNALAMLYDTQFLEKSGLAVCDLTDKSVQFSQETFGILMGAEALWGDVTCHNNGAGELPFSLVAAVHGQDGDKVIALSSAPVGLHLLPEPGLVLISNNEDGGADQLWLVNVLTGAKQSVDRDCAEFSVSGDGKLIVRGQAANEIRIYELAR